MARKHKYTLSHLHRVRDIMNKEKINKTIAIKKAGFSDPSTYYSTLKRFGLRETMDFNECAPVKFNFI